MKTKISCAAMLAVCVPAIAADRQPGRDAHGVRPTMHQLMTMAVEAQSGGVAGGSIPSWSALGPFGGDVHDVAVSPVDSNIVLAAVAPASGGAGALFRSTDGGHNWAPAAGLENKSCYDIEFAPDGTAYVGTIDSVWKSTNNGASWSPLNLGIGLNDQVFEVAIDPNNPLNIWIGVADALGNQTVNIMRSNNGGTSWFNRTPPLGSPMSGRAIAFNPNNSQEVYAGFAGGLGGGQVWVSTSGGAPGSWVNRSAGLPNTPVNHIVHDGSRVLVCGGQLFGGQNFGLYQSTNQGVNWSPLHSGWPSLVINDIAIDPNNANIIYVVSATQGAFRSTSGGIPGSWQFGIGGTSGLSLNAVRFAPGSSSHIFLGANSTGVLQSTDSGANFDITSTGIAKLNVVSIHANPADPQELAIAFEGSNDGGVYTSTDGGQSWQLEPVPATRYSNVTFAPDGTLYAISSGPSTIAPEGLYRRNPNGTWTGIGPNQGSLFESDLAALRFSESDPNLIFAGGADFGVAGSEATIWRNTNGGNPASWEKVYEGPASSEFVTDIRIVDGTSDTVLIASFVDFSSAATGGVVRSTNSGAIGSWGPSNTGLPATVRAGALSPVAGDANTFLLADQQFGASGGLYRTTNGGQSWSSTGFTGGQVIDVVADPTDANTVYIMRANATVVWRSTDGGTNFSPFNAGLSFSGAVNDLAYAPGSAGLAVNTPARLLLATGAGTYATDLGEPLNPADINGDGSVGVADLLIVINNWGACSAPCPPSCEADIAPEGQGNCNVDVSDLLMVISNWG